MINFSSFVRKQLTEADGSERSHGSNYGQLRKYVQSRLKQGHDPRQIAYDAKDEGISLASSDGTAIGGVSRIARELNIPAKFPKQSPIRDMHYKHFDEGKTPEDLHKMGFDLQAARVHKTRWNKKNGIINGVGQGRWKKLVEAADGSDRPDEDEHIGKVRKYGWGENGIRNYAVQRLIHTNGKETYKDMARKLINRGIYDKTATNVHQQLADAVNDHRKMLISKGQHAEANAIPRPSRKWAAPKPATQPKWMSNAGDASIEPPDEHIHLVRMRAPTASDHSIGAYAANRLRATNGKETFTQMVGKLTQYGINDGTTSNKHMSTHLIRYKNALRDAGRHDEANSIPEPVLPSPQRDKLYKFFDSNKETPVRDQNQRLYSMGHTPASVKVHRARWNKSQNDSEPV